ncbi:twin-arginine translocase subunit TatC [Candidatus Endowatersipora endosymbiont of Watersipora subatra]|uniref:twin-arginine translocase subunit TatC n=1 Tax=Candidatus Endowatersipora endosymbiont of Watersipora subatra TaxID=3077946 RepID=UPI00312CA334
MNDQDIESKTVPFIEHLTELRQRLFRIFIAFSILFFVSFYFSKKIFNILVIPYEKAAGYDRNLKLIFTAPQEFFLVQLRIAFFTALFFSFPFIATQIYKFMAPGLYKNERRAFIPFLFATPILFILGSFLVFFVVMPLAMSFFLSMQQKGQISLATIELLPRVSEYLGLIMVLTFAFGLVFQMPVVISLLARAGIVSSEALAINRKYAIVMSFIAAAILTPPDPISQICLAVPILILYELSIYATRFIERKKVERESINTDP